MTEKYLAIEIHGETFVMNDNDELGGLIDNDVPHTVIGQVCTEECNTTCLHYRQGTCPCKIMKNTYGEIIHFLFDSKLNRKERIMNKRTIQIDVIGKIEGTQFMKCKLYTDENIVIIMMNEFDYERLKKEGIFIRDGKTRDSAGVLNTTNAFIEEN